MTSCELIEEEPPCPEQVWYRDVDNDGLGVATDTLMACDQPAGYVDNDEDDNDMLMQLVDECGVCGGPGAPTWYRDADEDSLGNPNMPITSCEQPTGYVANDKDSDDTVNDHLSAIERTFGTNIDLENLLTYANQPIPNYINKDHTTNNPITDAGATLGRVLFYDKNLSVDNTISCASCHLQSSGFSDRRLLSQGVAGVTGRHAMRLVNARFAEEDNFFWDERATTLEMQTTQPIQDHIEMGFSGQNGDPALYDLITKLEALDYYQELFSFVYGDALITEQRMQLALAQFVRSIQSFDSRYDLGLAQTNNLGANFPNFTAEENAGKRLFMQGPGGGPGGGGDGGAGCNACHRAPEFDIDPNSRNNGIVGNPADPSMIDVTITRAPSLRDMVDPNGRLNGPLMHDGSLMTLRAVIEHYNAIPNVPGNNNLDRRLGGMNQPQNLNLSEDEMNALVAFLGTLTGSNVYTDERWSDPFQ